MQAPTLDKVIPALPAPQRGYGYVLNYTGPKAKAPREIIYGNKSVITRGIEDSTVCTAFSEHAADVTCAAFSPSGGWVCSGDNVGDVKVWGRTNPDGKRFCGPGGVKCVNDIAWDGTNQKLVVVGHGGAGKYAKVFQYDTGSDVGQIIGHTKTMLSVAYRQDRPFRIAATSEDNVVSFHAGPPFKPQNELVGGTEEGHARYPNKVRFSPDSSIFISVGADSKIIVFDGKTGDKIREIASAEKGHKGAIYSFDFSDDGKEIITCGADKTAKIWNVESGEVETTFTISESPQVDDMQMAVIWSGSDIMSVSLSGAINVLDRTAPEKPKEVIEGHKDKLTSVTTDIKTGRIYSSDVSGKVCMWDALRATKLSGAGHGDKGVKAMALSHDAATLVTIGQDNRILFNSTAEGTFDDVGVKLPKAAMALACGRASDMTAAITGNSILVYKGKELASTITTQWEPTCVAFNLDDSEIAVGGSDKQVHTFSMGDFKEVHAEDCLQKKVESVDYSSCGNYLAVSCGTYTLIFDKAWKQKNPSDWALHNAKVCEVKWSPDAKKVATLGTDLNLIIWDDVENFKNGRKEMKMAHRMGVVGVSWVDNDTVVTAGADGTMKTWKV